MNIQFKASDAFSKNSSIASGSLYKGGRIQQMAAQLRLRRRRHWQLASGWIAVRKGLHQSRRMQPFHLQSRGVLPEKPQTIHSAIRV